MIEWFRRRNYERGLRDMAEITRESLRVTLYAGLDTEPGEFTWNQMLEDLSEILAERVR